MDLDSLLENWEAIIQYRHRLVESHHRALFEDNEGLENVSLHQLRKNIQICLNDLCKLNAWLIEHDGGIRKVLHQLDKYENRLLNLHLKKDVLLREKQLWKRRDPSDLHQEETPVDTFGLTASHQRYLSRYIEDMGVNNTSLNDTNDTIATQLPRTKILDNLNILEEAQKSVAHEIKQLEVLLQSFKKDQAFVQIELSKLESLVKGEEHSIDSELNSVYKSIESLLKKIGFLKVAEPNSSVFSRLKNSTATYELENSELKVKEFISAQRESLKDLLIKHKQETHILKQQMESWRDVVNLVETLEENIRKRFSTVSKVDPVELEGLIRETIKEIEGLRCDNYHPDVISCIKDEIFALGTANEQLTSPNNNIPPSSFGPIYDNPTFLITGTSPPKVSITKNILPSSPIVDTKKSV
ncbi:Atg23p Ecym_7030 [Eremothecium cymbalariae DBVPG|uniref:Autophagy-related protein 23 n=1 Tax=Eremothecium cymbalariae (strain CBS 270.75 / DBVPG 7215 / KCTC 17166 / NRRL Y-17582) TaxID=931890 RepID=G8JVM2_ERECY|nr:hypothetical protein Ecym_7030 [Eremothecium cymbalariae DBVPG\